MGRIRIIVAGLLLVSVASAGFMTTHTHPAARLRASAAAAPTSTTAPVTTTTVGPPSTTTTAVIADPAVTLPPAPPGAAKVIVSPRGIVLPVLGPDPAGYKVRTPCGATAVANGTPVTSAAVVLDPGHGGGEAGAVGPNGLKETTLNMAVTLQAKAALERQGLSVVLTRTGEYRMTLQSRADVVHALQPRVFVSIHHNAEPDGPFPKPGTETYYQVASPDSKRLSGLIYEEVVKALSQYQLPWVADTDAGAKYRRGTSGDDYYAVLRLTHGTTSALAELAFITDAQEAALLARPDVQQVEGEAVARGIVRYLTTRDPGSGYTEPYPRTEPAGGGGGPQGCTDPTF